MTSLRQWIKAFPESPAPRRWFIAGSALVVCVVLGVTLLVPEGRADETTQTLFHTAVVIVAALAVISPLPAAIGFGFLLQISAMHGTFQSPLIFFSTLGIVSILALVEKPPVSGASAAILWYLALTGFGNGQFLPDDAETAAILGGLLFAGWVGGFTIREALAGKRQESRRFKRQLAEERERAVRALHGSVAASLTSVVLRSESMAMNTSEKSRESSLLIAEDARRAMREVRELIRFMRTDEAAASDNPIANGPDELIESISAIINVMRSHGFTVIESGISEQVLDGASLHNGYTVLREIKTNALKYADRAKPIIIAAVRDDDALTLAIQNTVSGRERDVQMTSGIGLDEAISLVKREGGKLTFNQTGDQWRSELTLPLDKNSR